MWLRYSTGCSRWQRLNEVIRIWILCDLSQATTLLWILNLWTFAGFSSNTNELLYLKHTSIIFSKTLMSNIYSYLYSSKKESDLSMSINPRKAWLRLKSVSKSLLWSGEGHRKIMEGKKDARGSVKTPRAPQEAHWISLNTGLFLSQFLQTLSSASQHFILSRVKFHSPGHHPGIFWIWLPSSTSMPWEAVLRSMSPSCIWRSQMLTAHPLWYD